MSLGEGPGGDDRTALRGPGPTCGSAGEVRGMWLILRSWGGSCTCINNRDGVNQPIN